MDVHAHSLTCQAGGSPFRTHLLELQGRDRRRRAVLAPVQGYFSLDSFTQDQHPILVSVQTALGPKMSKGLDFT